MNIPIELFFGVISILIVIPLIAYTMKTRVIASLFFFISGASMIFFVLSIDNIEVEIFPDNSTTTGSFTNYEFEPRNFELRDATTFEPNSYTIMFILMGIALVVVGVLIEYN